ncbi:hypothetical protein D3C73_721980 [compost metagenome]
MYLRPFQPARITRAIDTLVMLQRTVCREQRDIRFILENPVADFGMGLHMTELLVTEHTGLLNDFDRDLRFAYIMQQRAHADDPQLFPAIAMGNSEHQRIQTNIQGVNIQVVVGRVHIKQHNHGIFLCGQIIQNGIHHLGEFFVQMIKPLRNAGSA